MLLDVIPPGRIREGTITESLLKKERRRGKADWDTGCLQVLEKKNLHTRKKKRMGGGARLAAQPAAPLVLGSPRSVQRGAQLGARGFGRKQHPRATAQGGT